MKHATLAVLLAAGMLALAPLSQAHADDDWGAAALGFAFGAAMSGAPTVIYRAPARVYVPARRHHWREAQRWRERREWRRHEWREHRRHEWREHRRHERRWRHHEWHHHHRYDDDD